MLAKSSLVLGSGATVLAWITLPTFSHLVYDSRDVGVLAAVLGLTPIVELGRVVGCAGLQGARRMGALARVENAQEYLRVAFVVTGALMTGTAMGPILGTGGLAMIIPPSSLGVLLASIAQVDVGRLLIAGLLPGLMLATLYALMITFLLWKNPESAPSYDVEPSSLGEKIYQICVNILPMGLVVFMVIGFIVLGWATPSESASFGVVGVVILAVARRVFTWVAFKTSLQGTIRVAGMVFFILMNSTVFSQLLSMSGASRGLVGWATGFEVAPLLILTAMFLVLIMLGMFMDQVSMMLITVPIFYPLAISLGYDPIWFSLIVLMSLEMAATTPPFGLLLFIMLGMVKETTLGEVAMAALPYLFCDLVLIIILVIVPGVGLWLPSLMGT